jgi:peptidoglycan/xylan/chitin deacetylase (PgdA/CDA1 family)
LPNDLMLSSTQLRALRDAGMLIGGHTRSHPILARLDDADAREEIVGGKQRLEALLGEPISLFAYPNGKPEEDFAARHAAMARAAGFEAALTTAAGMARQDTDPFQLPRFTPWDRTHWRFGLRMARNMRMPVHLVA